MHRGGERPTRAAVHPTSRPPRPERRIHNPASARRTRSIDVERMPRIRRPAGPSASARRGTETRGRQPGVVAVTRPAPPPHRPRRTRAVRLAGMQLSPLQHHTVGAARGPGIRNLWRTPPPSFAAHGRPPPPAPGPSRQTSVGGPASFAARCRLACTAPTICGKRMDAASDRSRSRCPRRRRASSGVVDLDVRAPAVVVALPRLDDANDLGEECRHRRIGQRLDACGDQDEA